MCDTISSQISKFSNPLYKWDKEKVIIEIKELSNKLGRRPKASDNEATTCAAKHYFGSWNKALFEAIGSVNQKRHDLNVEHYIIDFIKKYNRLPLREEFNGSEWPYWETITLRLNVKRWSDIYTKIDLSNISYKASTRHGTGRIYILNGIVYLSRQEYLIGKYLEDTNIKFDKEVPYINSKHIFDFYLPDFDTYIEYYGMATNEYKKRILEKQKFYNGRNVIEIFKQDNTIKKLALEVQRLQYVQSNMTDGIVQN
jgi:hypothetical protein